MACKKISAKTTEIYDTEDCVDTYMTFGESESFVNAEMEGAGHMVHRKRSAQRYAALT